MSSKVEKACVTIPDASPCGLIVTRIVKRLDCARVLTEPAEARLALEAKVSAGLGTRWH